MRLFVTPQDQGLTNGCGTTCLSMAMDYWRPGRPENARTAIDGAVRPFDMFTAPGDLLRYARFHGYRAAMLVDATLDDLLRLLDRGLPTLVLCDRSGSRGDALHYMLAVGQEGGSVLFADPAGGQFVGLTGSELEALWQDLHLRGLPTCVSRVILVLSPPEGPGFADLLPVRPLQSAGAVLLATLAVKDVAIALRRRDPARMAAGVVEAIASLPGSVGSVVAGLGSRGRKKARNPVSWAAALVPSALGWSLQLAGMPVAWLGQAIGAPLAWISMRRPDEDELPAG
ncbi:MAG TPA: C39 family peptidase [Stenomitos sp.]